jgi:hypothetical protein
MITSKLAAVILTFAAGTLHAQDLAPQLAPLVAKHQADQAALDAQKATTLARVQQPYVAALDGAEKTATSAGALEVVAAITKEREALKSGLMAPAFPEGLPKNLQSTRKAFLDGTARASAEQAPRQKAIDADYLRALAALQPKAVANAELTKQIAAEKEKLLANASGATGDKKPAAANSRNVVVNGAFDAADGDGHPRGWSFYGPGADTAFKVVREGTNAVLHMAVAGAPVSIGEGQSIPIPPRAKTIMVRGKVRGKIEDHLPNDPNYGADVLARFHDANDKDVGQILLVGRPDGGWKALSQSGPVPPGAKTVGVACVGWWVAGTFDFDDIEVEFR